MVLNKRMINTSVLIRPIEVVRATVQIGFKSLLVVDVFVTPSINCGLIPWLGGVSLDTGVREGLVII